MSNTLKHKFRQIKKLPWWLYVPPALLLKTFKACMRIEMTDPYGYGSPKKPIVSITWHNRLMFFPVLFPLATRKKTVAIVSPSRDGQYIVDLIARFGLKSLRGSTSKRGGQVMFEAKKAIEEGFNVSFTPDGPRGPKYKMSRGPIHLASITGAQLVPVMVNYSDYWEIKSWDNFQIPKPWAKLKVKLSEGLNIPPDLDEEGIEKWRKTAEDLLMAITVDKK